MLENSKWVFGGAYLMVSLCGPLLACSNNTSAAVDARGEASSLVPDSARLVSSDADARVVTVGPDADPMLPAEFSAPAPPAVSCAADGDAGACDLPPSSCAQVTACEVGTCQTQWLAFYENPRCVGGRCVWDQSFFHCENTCQAGACFTFIGTVP